MRASSCSQAPGVASAPPPARLLPRLPIGWHLPVVPVAEQNAIALKGFSTCDVRHVRNAASSTSSEASPVFRHPGELDLSLREYMVVLEKPVGLTLAPDPRTGQVVVQDIKVGSPAHKCGLIQVGDVVQSVSAVFGDDMWAAADIRRVRWAINSRMGDVRLILERCRRLGHGGATTSWYSSGKTGVATRELAGMQLPFAFTSPSPDILASSTALLSGSSSGLTRSGGSSMIPAATPTGSSNGLGAIPGPSSTTSAAGFATAATGLGAAAAAAGRGGGATPYNSLASVSGVGVGVGLADGSLLVELPGAGRSMTVSFHRNTATQPPPSRRAAAAVAARAAALARLRRELQQARHMPRLDLSGQGQPRAVTAEAFMGSLPSSSSSSPSSSGAGTRGATSPGAKSPSPSGSSTPGGSSSSGGGSSSSSSNSTSSSMKTSEAAAGMAPPPPPVVDVVAPAPSKEDEGDGPVGGGGGSSSGGGGGGILGLRFGGAGGGGGALAAAAAAPPARSTGPKERRVVSVLPWLLVALGRLEHRHIAHIASSRSLGALLELSLTRSSSSGGSGGSGGSSGGSDAAAGAAGAASTSGSTTTTTTGSSSTTGTSTSTSSSNSSSSSSSSSSSTTTGSSSSSTTTGSSSSSGGGYLVVRGSDLAPLGADMGRASYASLLAAAEAAGNSCAPSSSAAARGGGAAPATGGAAGPVPTAPTGPAGEAPPPPPPPPPGSAAATAVLIDGPDALKASAGAAAGGGGSSSAAAATPSLVDAALAAGSSASSSGGSTTSNTGGGGGLGSSTMAFLGRSIFINLRPSFGGANPANPSNPSANANSPLPSSSSSSSSASSSSSSSLASSGSRGGLPRYDAARVAHLLNAAASLQRLAFRRGGRLHRARRDACAVLLHCCDEGMESDVAVLLAGWLHWYGRLPLQEAALAAETALGGAPVDTALLEAGTAALLAGGRERCSRVVLTWKYGGLSAYVAGDVVASWAARVPMVRCRSPLGCKGDTHPGHFFLEVTGLPPGAYFYKYIVDGTWAVDSLSNKVLDSAGNWNNVLVVPEPPQVLTSREGLALARWQAARMALEAKMGLSGPGAFMQRGPH